MFEEIKTQEIMIVHALLTPAFVYIGNVCNTVKATIEEKTKDTPLFLVGTESLDIIKAVPRKKCDDACLVYNKAVKMIKDIPNTINMLEKDERAKHALQGYYVGQFKVSRAADLVVSSVIINIFMALIYLVTTNIFKDLLGILRTAYVFYTIIPVGICLLCYLKSRQYQRKI